MSAYGKSVVWRLHSWGLSVHERGHHWKDPWALACPAHLAGSAAAPPCGPASAPSGRSSSAPGRESTKTRQGPGDSCHGSLFFGEGALREGRTEEVAQSPPGRPYPLLHLSGWALTTVNSTHSSLQLGFTAGRAPGPIHIHEGAAPYMLGLPVLPAHVAQWLLRDPGVAPGTLGRRRPSGWEEGDQPRRWGPGRQGVLKG